MVASQVPWTSASGDTDRSRGDPTRPLVNATRRPDHQQIGLVTTTAEQRALHGRCLARHADENTSLTSDYDATCSDSAIPVSRADDHRHAARIDPTAADHDRRRMHATPPTTRPPRPDHAHHASDHASTTLRPRLRRPSDHDLPTNASEATRHRTFTTTDQRRRRQEAAGAAGRPQLHPARRPPPRRLRPWPRRRSTTHRPRPEPRCCPRRCGPANCLHGHRGRRADRGTGSDPDDDGLGTVVGGLATTPPRRLRG